jgi:hypothetical protein
MLGARRGIEYTTAWYETNWPYLEEALNRLQAILANIGRLLVAIDNVCASLGFPPDGVGCADDPRDANFEPDGPAALVSCNGCGFTYVGGPLDGCQGRVSPS